jgi:hypothetical protein
LWESYRFLKRNSANSETFLLERDGYVGLRARKKEGKASRLEQREGRGSSREAGGGERGGFERNPRARECAAKNKLISVNRNSRSTRINLALLSKIFALADKTESPELRTISFSKIPDTP